MKNKHAHTKHAIKTRGEVFTPTPLVNEMLDKLPPELFTDVTRTFLDNSCGNGQFLYEIMRRKVKAMAALKTYSPYQAHIQSLSTIYGVEIDQKNAEDCRLRLLNGHENNQVLRDIVNHNIITADALDHDHPGWEKVGFYWDENDKPNIEKYNERKQKEEEEKLKKKQEELSVNPSVIIPVVSTSSVSDSNDNKSIKNENKSNNISPASLINNVSKFVTMKEYLKDMEKQISNGECF